ncbi:MAG: AmmeMemoRadiSam system protein B [Candidatus Magnetominusculus sp. LBB02]|nr:AmmeMemoRadiSam system protein B [Candidatus Magnetominusculus sp. LBB02]
MKRPPTVAGHFYSATETALAAEVETYMSRVEAPSQKIEPIGIISPHAGFFYSGAVAAAVYSAIQFPDTFILIGPNHTGLGGKFSMMSHGQWEVPTHTFDIDEDLGGQLIKTGVFKEEHSAHSMEHSLEVQLPFIAHYSKIVKIVPITVMGLDVEECQAAGEAIAKVVSTAGKYIIIAVSSDMSHYLPEEQARKKDKLALDMILNLDPGGLYNIVQRERITMCGVLPAAIMLYAANALGAKMAELIKYTTSAEVGGDYSRVVGYAGVVVN